MIKRAWIYFSSGTGNSYRVATWFGEHARQQGASVEVIQIEQAEPKTELQGEPGDQLLGIVCPSHGFTAPWHLIKFAWQLPRSRGMQAFCCATRGGFKIGSFFGPGLSGTATFLLALILALKGYKVRGALCLNMPINWTTLMPGQQPASTRAIIARAQPMVAAFAARMLGGQRAWLSLNNVIEFTLGLALIPLSLIYLYVGRIGLAKLFFATNACNSCGRCESTCPTGGVTLKGRKKRPYWNIHCESCMRCMAFCPQTAIESGHSWGALLFYISLIPLTAWGSAWLTARLAGLPASGLLFYAIALAWAGPSMLLVYSGFHALLAIRPINALFTYTTLTHWYRRYKEPDVKMKELLGKRPRRPPPPEGD